MTSQAQTAPSLRSKGRPYHWLRESCLARICSCVFPLFKTTAMAAYAIGLYLLMFTVWKTFSRLESVWRHPGSSKDPQNRETTKRKWRPQNVWLISMDGETWAGNFYSSNLWLRGWQNKDSLVPRTFPDTCGMRERQKELSANISNPGNKKSKPHQFDFDLYIHSGQWLLPALRGSERLSATALGSSAVPK